MKKFFLIFVIFLCFFLTLHSDEKTNLIIFRGSLAVGKTTLSNLFQKKLLEKGYKVAIIHWDDIFFLVDPHEDMDEDLALKVSKSTFDLAYSLRNNRQFDFLIIEGTFVMKKELELIQQLQKVFDASFLFKLICDEKIQLYRNITRIEEDYMEEERILFVNRLKNWSNGLKDEIIIDTGNKSENELINLIYSIIN